MSATETWCLAAAVLAAAAVAIALLNPRLPSAAAGLTGALHAAATGCIAVALLLALP